MAKQVEDAENQSTPNLRPGLTVSWLSLSIALTVLVVASVATLVTVVTVNGIDLLSTVALALAILAFIAQLVGSWTQSQSSAQMSADTYRINAETKGLLSLIRGQSDSLIANQKDHFGEMLQALINKDVIREAVQEGTASAEGSESADTPTTTGGVDEQVVADAIEARLLKAFAGSGAKAGTPATRRTKPYASFVKLMETYPNEVEGKPALEVLQGLEPLTLAMLARRANEDLARARRGEEPRGFTYGETELTPSSRKLRDLGLMEYEPGERDGRKLEWRRLSPLGQTVARFITARGAVPQWLRDAQE